MLMVLHDLGLTQQLAGYWGRLCTTIRLLKQALLCQVLGHPFAAVYIGAYCCGAVDVRHLRPGCKRVEVQGIRCGEVQVWDTDQAWYAAREQSDRYMSLSATGQWDFETSAARENYDAALREYPAQAIIDLAALRDNMAYSWDGEKPIRCRRDWKPWGRKRRIAGKGLSQPRRLHLPGCVLLGTA